MFVQMTPAVDGGTRGGSTKYLHETLDWVKEENIKSV